MGYDRDDILEQIEKNIPTKCERCGARLYFKGSGRYVCPRCHVDYYDDFGVIKNILMKMDRHQQWRFRWRRE